MGFSTDAIHAGQIADPTTGAVITPIYQTSTYHQEELGKHKGFEYGRTQNPTRFALEANIAALEKGKYGFAFGSGLAAIDTVLKLLSAGDHVIAGNNMYGGTFRLFDKVLTRFGLTFTYVDPSDVSGIKKAITSKTRMIFCETPTNPMMMLTDIEAVAALSAKHHCISVVDNTFMTPYYQNPLALGCDIVLHSTTKYLNGHSDAIGGMVVTSSDSIAEQMRFHQNAVGAVPGPFDCWLVLRSTKTLAVRMKQHSENAMAIALCLMSHPKVKRIFYPGLESHPQYELAKKQMRGFGGMISIDLDGMEHARCFVDALRIFTLAESLGGVESLVCHPVTMTHASVPEADRAKVGLTEGIVRLSVGIEDVEDLISDIHQALDAM